MYMRMMKMYAFALRDSLTGRGKRGGVARETHSIKDKSSESQNRSW
jgi:hypothetical protein